MTFARLEQYLLPPPEIARWNNGNFTIEQYTTIQKVAYCTKNFLAFTFFLIVSPLTLAHDYFTQKQVVLKPRKAPDIFPQLVWPPEQRGFATSLFQTSGLGTKYAASPELKGKCDWDKWMDNPDHVIHSNGFNDKSFFTDVLTNPTSYIEMLKAQNVTAHRFSLEWSVIQPKQDGEFDEKAIAIYQNFIQKLIENGITPSVTLSHFVLPEWFHEIGGFLNDKNIDRYVKFALEAMRRFPQVKDWWSFNELGVKAFQQTREVYPTDVPIGSFLFTRVHAAGICTRNMLIAHCKLHQEVARQFPDKKVGVTHQWLKFDTANGNWLEKLVAYFFTKFSFTPVYQFFQDGHYSFEFPFMANIHFEVPQQSFEINKHFLMRLGVQAYPKPMVKMGLNHGEIFPGLPETIKNFFLFSFGSTCEPGGTVMRFGPRWKAEAMDEILDDAYALTDEVYITEFGSDASIQKWHQKEFNEDDKAQADYLKQLVERIHDYSTRTLRTIKGIFCWSDLRRQMEWENGLEVKLGIIKAKVNEHRQIIEWEPTFASKYLANIYKNENQVKNLKAI